MNASVIFSLALALATTASAGLVAPDSVRTGITSFYKAKGGRGACDLPGTHPWDTLYAAINRRDWTGSASCGACLMVRGDSDSVVVRVNDRCPGCKGGGIDISPAAFRRLAPLGRGRTAIAWRFTACPESSLAIARTRSSSVHWSSVQIWGLPWPTDSFLVRADTSWIPFRRQRHNHFTARGLPPTPWTVRLVDMLGRERIDSVLVLEPGVTLHPDLPDSTAPASAPPVSGDTATPVLR